MKTLNELIVSAKCRKGASAGTNKHGAFWFACEPIIIRRFGGDGIGETDANCVNYLQLRHYRDGSVKAVVNSYSWHQNHGHCDTYRTADNLLDRTTVEDVIVCFKNISDKGSHAYSDSRKNELTEALTALGMIEALPAPDAE